MALSIDHLTKVISVPQADLTLISGTLFELDTETVFRQGVNALLDDEEGIVLDDAISHNTEVTVAGTTFARTIEVINGFSVTFTPDDQYTVRLAGSNNNIFDVENAILNQNQVQIISQNSAGLISVDTGSAVLPGDVDDIRDAVWNAVRANFAVTGSMGESQDTVIRSELAQSGSTTTIVLDAGAHSTNHWYRGASFQIIEGTGVGQTGLITSYTGATKAAIVKPTLLLAPDSTSRIEIRRGRSNVAVWGADNPQSIDGVTLGWIHTFPQIMTAGLVDVIRDAIFAKVMENSETFAEQTKLMRAEAAGKVVVTAGGTNVAFRDAADSKDRIDATVDSDGQRTSVTTDGT